MNSTRFQAFDAIKCFAIYLVLWGHAIQYVMGGDYENNLVFRTIYAFHMPLFMTISGYFATSSLKLPIVPFFKRKFMQLLYPAFVFGILVFVLLFSMSSFYKVNFIINYFLSTYWFLKSCFVCFCIAYLSKVTNSNLVGAFFILLFQFVTISNYQLNLMLPSFFFGIYLRQNAPLLWERVMLLKILKTAWPLFLIMMVFYIAGKEHIHFVIYHLLRLIVALLGSLSFISLFVYIIDSKGRKISPLFLRIGTLTLGIYILQTTLYANVLPKILHCNHSLLSQCMMPLIAVVVLVFCSLGVILLRHFKLTKIIFFGK